MGKTLSENIVRYFVGKLLERSITMSFGDCHPLLDILREHDAENYLVPPGYTEYMSSQDWKEKRKQFLIAMPRCITCGGSETLHVHHVGYDGFGHEDCGDCVVLCLRCHAFIHPLGELPAAWALTRRSEEMAALADSLAHYNVDCLIPGVVDSDAEGDKE